VLDVRRTDPFSPSSLAQWTAVLQDRRAWLAARGIHFLVVVMPNKETVYAGAVPQWLSRAPGPSRLAQLQHALAATQVDFFDLSDAIESHKAEGRGHGAGFWTE
jgi:hypothetical protein